MKRRHPIMGFFAGLLLGIGVALMLFVFGILPLTALWLGLLALIGAVLGVLIAFIAPSRQRSAPA